MNGWVKPGFEEVATTFERNFTHRKEVGAGFCAYYRGERVVHLWGGLADRTSQRPWEEDTVVPVFSATKGMVAACFLALEDRGRIDLDAPVAELWPGFAQAGKERITTRQVLNHTAGLSAIDAPLILQDFADIDNERLLRALESQEPAWEPGSNQGYGATSFGAYTQQIFYRVTGKTVGAWFREHIAEPLNADVHIGSPESVRKRAGQVIPVPKRRIVGHQLRSMLTRRTPEGRLFRRVVLAKNSLPRRALANPSMGPTRFLAINDPDVQALELPWMNGMATADGLARVYSSLATTGATEDGTVIWSAKARARIVGIQSWSDRDAVLQKPIGYSQGFNKEEHRLVSPHPESFGHTGAGGPIGMGDPTIGLAVGYVQNRMDWRIRSPRCVELCRATYRALGLW